MIEFPDVLGMELDEATALLESEGLTFVVTETEPNRNPLQSGTLRVIKVQLSKLDDENEIKQMKNQKKQSVVLTVCKI